MIKIEEYLKGLTDIETGEPLFDNVTNLNQITSNIASESALREIIDFYSKQFFELNNEAKKNYKLVTDVLLKNDFFLVVNTNLIFDVIEYQFYLYEVKNIDKNILYGNNSFPTTNPISPLRTENIIVNLKDGDKYFELETAIERSFPKVNLPPIARITINQNIEESEGVYFCSVQDTLKLFSFFSTDLDTEKRNLKYSWRQIDLKGNINVDNSPVAQIIRKRNDVEIIFGNEGTYKFGLQVYDGINYSEDTIDIEALLPPEILVDKRRIKNISYQAATMKVDTIEKSNKFTLLSTKYSGWDLLIQKQTLNKKDTFDILKDYNGKRKEYDMALYRHKNGVWSDGKITYPPKPKDLPKLTDFLKNSLSNPYKLKIDTALIAEGIFVSFPVDYDRLRNTKLDVYLSKNGVSSNKQSIRVFNRAYSRYSIFFASQQPTLVKLKHSNIPNDSIEINFREYEFKINRRFLGLFSEEGGPFRFDTRNSSLNADVGVSYTFIPKKEFHLDTILFINSAFSVSASINPYMSIEGIKLFPMPFFQATLKAYPILKKAENSSDELAKVEALHFSFNVRSGVVISLDIPPVDFIGFYDWSFVRSSKVNDIFFERKNIIALGVGIRFKFLLPKTPIFSLRN